MKETTKQHVLGRTLARELSQQELELVSGGVMTQSPSTSLPAGDPIQDDDDTTVH